MCGCTWRIMKWAEKNIKHASMITNVHKTLKIAVVTLNITQIFYFTLDSNDCNCCWKKRVVQRCPRLRVSSPFKVAFASFYVRDELASLSQHTNALCKRSVCVKWKLIFIERDRTAAAAVTSCLQRCKKKKKKKGIKTIVAVTHVNVQVWPNFIWHQLSLESWLLFYAQCGAEMGNLERRLDVSLRGNIF